MKGNFLKFKRKLIFARILKSCLAGIAAGLSVGGIFLGLSRLAIIGFEPILSLPVGAGVFLLIFISFYLLLRTSDKKLARQLDSRLSLREKVQTALAFEGEEGGMIELQREDAQRTLGNIKTRKFRVKRVWIYFLALILGAAILFAGFSAPNKRDWEPPEVIIPFEISEVQIAGIEELIRYTTESSMEEPYRSEVTAALTTLLGELKAATTEPEMEASVAKAITEIAGITYDSSSMTEILNAMWSTEDENIRALAKALNTSYWTEPDWGDFAEKYSALRESFTKVQDEVEPAEESASEPEAPTEEELMTRLKWRVETFTLKLGNALVSSKINESDILYSSLNKLINGSADGEFGGISAVASGIEGKTLEDASEEIDGVFGYMTDELYATISTQKTNTNVGEYVLKKLSTLFGVPVPLFERPEFAKNGGSSDSEDDFKDDEEGNNGGGIGEGVVFGSDDLVLDPLTGQYVEYGTLLANYNALMIEKLGNDKYGYTEEQKRAIEKYFALLYGGFKDDGEK